MAPLFVSLINRRSSHLDASAIPNHFTPAVLNPVNPTDTSVAGGGVSSGSNNSGSGDDNAGSRTLQDNILPYTLFFGAASGLVAYVMGRV